MKKPFLYEITKENSKAYLFGTIHTGVVVEDLPESFWSYFNQSDIFVSEADLDDMDRLVTLLAPRMLRVGGEPIPSKSFTELEKVEIFKRIKPFVGKATIDIDQLSLFGIYNLLLHDLITNRQEVSQVTRGEYVRFRSKFILDQQLLNIATKKQNKIMDTLDDINSESYLGCYVGSADQVLKNIRKILTMEYAPSGVPQALKLAELYRQGDEVSFAKEIKLDEAPQCLLKERNESWLPKILSVLKNNELPFFAVGVGHIIAEKNSLIDLLKSRGYSVRRMTELQLKDSN